MPGNMDAAAETPDRTGSRPGSCEVRADEPGYVSPVLHVRIVTLFPQMFDSWLAQGVVSRAIERGIVSLELVDLRPFGIGPHHVTDDYPFGGGAGMVMKPEPLFAAVESLEADAATPVVLLSPRGRLLTQRVAQEIAALPEIILISGHYEGVDERVRQHLVTDEVSIGDYVLSCGELAAMVVTDVAVRLIPGALSAGSADEESFGRACWSIRTIPVRRAIESGRSRTYSFRVTTRTWRHGADSGRSWRLPPGVRTYCRPRDLWMRSAAWSKRGPCFKLIRSRIPDGLDNASLPKYDEEPHSPHRCGGEFESWTDRNSRFTLQIDGISGKTSH